jgi:hypothetical protein
LSQCNTRIIAKGIQRLHHQVQLIVNGREVVAQTVVIQFALFQRRAQQTQFTADAVVHVAHQARALLGQRLSLIL